MASQSRTAANGSVQPSPSVGGATVALAIQPRPVPPSPAPSAAPSLPATEPTASRSSHPAGSLRPADDVSEPEYRGAGRWTDLPLPGAGGPSPVGPDPFADDLTEPTDQQPRSSALDRVLELAQGDTYRLFLGGAILVIAILIIALAALR